MLNVLIAESIRFGFDTVYRTEDKDPKYIFEMGEFRVEKYEREIMDLNLKFVNDDLNSGLTEDSKIRLKDLLMSE